MNEYFNCMNFCTANKAYSQHSKKKDPGWDLNSSHGYSVTKFDKLNHSNNTQIGTPHFYRL